MYLTHDPIPLETFSNLPGRSCGALSVFMGIVRDHDGGRRIRALHYECYEPMAERVLGDLVVQAHQQWDLGEVRVLHRVGLLKVGEAAVAIAADSAHRDEAFQACRFLIERIKTEVPIWKKQFFEDGTNEWVVCHYAAGAVP